MQLVETGVLAGLQPEGREESNTTGSGRFILLLDLVCPQSINLVCFKLARTSLIALEVGRRVNLLSKRLSSPRLALCGE